MNRSAVKPSRRMVRYLAPVACVVMLGVGATACGSSSKTDTGGSTGSGSGSGGTTPSVATTEAKSGGAGF